MAGVTDTGDEVRVDDAAIGGRSKIIFPPPELRNIVDKTANFVARNGADFESRIMQNEASNQKFNFLKPADPYHAYYRSKVDQVRSGVEAAPASDGAAPPATDDAGAAPKPAAGEDASAQKKVGEKRSLADLVKDKPKQKVLKEPEKKVYMILPPPSVTSQDVEIIKLTAQFTARNGRTFLAGLTQREGRNSQFDFLKPNHPLFSFFTSLVDAYSKCLHPPATSLERLKLFKSASAPAAAPAAATSAAAKSGVTSIGRKSVLERCGNVFDWKQYVDRKEREDKDEKDGERDFMSSIDWHEFVIVETIDFAQTGAEDDDLPAPVTDLQTLVMSNQSIDVAALSRKEGDPASGGAGGGAPAAAAAGGAGGADGDDDDMDMSMDDEDDGAALPLPEPHMNIKPAGYVPASAAGAGASGQFQVCPITGQKIPVEQFAEHMRIILLDPRWREQKEKAADVQKNMVFAKDVNANLSRFAESRTDIFGKEERAIGERVNEGGEGAAAAAAGAANGGSITEKLAAIQKTNNAGPAAPLPGQHNNGSAPPPPGVIPHHHMIGGGGQAGGLGGQGGGGRGPGGSGLLPTPGQPPPGWMPPAGMMPPPPMMMQQQQQQPPSHMMQAPPLGAPPPRVAGGRGDHQAQPAWMQAQNAAAGLQGGGDAQAQPPAAKPVSDAPPAPVAPPAPAPPMPPAAVIPAAPQQPPPMPVQETLTEKEFLDKYPDELTFIARVEKAKAEGFDGQLITVKIAPTATIVQLKEYLQEQLGQAPLNKIKVKTDRGFLKDESSLAHYNVFPGATVDIGLKSRGGR